MGFNSENAARLCFDIETYALDDAGEYLEEPTAPANYKDPQKIADYIVERRASLLEKAACDLDLCRVVSIAWQDEQDLEPIVLVARTPADEAPMLAAFWDAVGERHLLGFNVLDFDLPVLLRRALYLAQPCPAVQIDRYRHPQVTDLMQELAFGRKELVRSLDFYAKRLGCPVTDTMTGADIAAAVREERWTDIASHARADVQKTCFLATRVGLFRPQPAVMTGAF